LRISISEITQKENAMNKLNKHVMADRLATGFGGLYGEKMKFFREGTDAPHVSAVVQGVEVEFTPPAGLGPVGDDVDEGQQAVLGEYRVPVRYREGGGADAGVIEGLARYRLLAWAGREAETLIYHHGSGETNYGARIRRIARTAGWKEKNLIAVSVPFNGSMQEYLYGVGSLRRFVFMLASSVVLTEKLVGFLREIGNARVVCAGMSLGGWVTNLHHSYFDSCSAYKPIFAGAAPDHLFTGTVYRRMLAESADPAAVSAALNFEADFAARDKGSVYPCMARYDQYIVLERQTQHYRPENVRIIERGHVTGAAAYRELAEHLG
jgi:hypothetical protein